MFDQMADEVLTAEHPTTRQWIIRGAAEVIVREHRLDWAFPEEVIGKASIVDASGRLFCDSSLFLAQLSPAAWAQLAIEVCKVAKYAEREGWCF
jgi:hypothetical protein